MVCCKGFRKLLCATTIELQVDYKMSPKVTNTFQCEPCHYTCCKSSDFTKHLSTRKHQKNYAGVTFGDNCDQKVAKYECKCGNNYVHRQGLYKHKKICSISQGENNDKNNNKSSDNMHHPISTIYEKQLSEQSAIISNLTNLVTTMLEKMSDKNVIETIQQ